MSEGQNPTLTRLAELEGRVDRLEQKEREMSEVNVAATEHPGNTVAEQGETVSLHEQLREADKDREAGKYGVRYQFWATGDQIAAIQEVIEAPWRERVAELEAERDRWVDRAYHSDELKLAAMERHDALKDRADAQEGIVKAGKSLWSAAMGALVILRDLHPETQSLETVKDLWELAGAFEAIAYDAADRAGETQEHKCVCTVPPESGMCDCMADQTAPSPTDAAAGEPMRITSQTSSSRVRP